MRARHLVLALATLSSAYLSWSVLGRTAPPTETPLRLVLVDGPLDGAADLVAVQPWLEPADYKSADALAVKLQQMLDVAVESGLLSERALVVLPAYIGTPLFFVGEKREVFTREHFWDAVDLVAWSNIPLLLRSLAVTQGDDRIRAATIAMKGAAMARDYEAVMARLASRYGVTLVAGSILLPAPEVRDGHITAGYGPVAQASFVFGPDGHVLGMARAVSRSQLDRDIVVACAIDEVRAIDTPLGRVGVLIGDDALHPDVADALRRQGVTIVAVPAFVHPDGALLEPWAPVDARLWDLHGETPTVAEAWQRLGPTRRTREIGARATIVSTLRGNLWDLGDDGASLVDVEGAVVRGPNVEGGVILGAAFTPGDSDPVLSSAAADEPLPAPTPSSQPTLPPPPAVALPQPLPVAAAKPRAAAAAVPAAPLATVKAASADAGTP